MSPRPVIGVSPLGWAPTRKFAIGERWNRGEFADYAEAERVLGLTRSSIKTYARVARLVPPENRVPGVGWKAFMLIASLPAEAQRRLLWRALDEGWSKADLRDGSRSRRRRADELVASLVAEQIFAEVPIARNGRRVLKQVDGRWVNAEDDLHLLLAQRLGSEWTRRRGYEVIDFMRALAPTVEEVGR